MNFSESQHRLCEQLRARVRNGEITERGFARMLGISQPHIHNVLKGARCLSPESADFVLNILNWDMLHLFSEAELRGHLRTRGAPACTCPLTVLDCAVGPGHRLGGAGATLTIHAPHRSWTRRRNLVGVRIAPHAHMAATLGECDFAVLEPFTGGGRDISAEHLYVLEDGGSAVFRWLRASSRYLYIADDYVLHEPLKWERRDIHTGMFLVRAKAIWIGQAAELALPEPRRRN